MFRRIPRDRPWLAFPIGVVNKFAEDRAGYLAALVAHFGFFSLFPLMLAFTSAVAFLLTDPERQREFSSGRHLRRRGGRAEWGGGRQRGPILRLGRFLSATGDRRCIPILLTGGPASCT